MKKLSVLMTVFTFSAIECTSQIDDYYSTADEAYLKKRLKVLNENIKEYGIIKLTGFDEYLLTGYSYGEFYDWDLYFENIYMSYYGINEYCFTNLKLFLKRQYLNGYVSRTLLEPRVYQHFKPFLAQIALLGSKQTQDYSWLLEVVNASENYSTPDDWTMNRNFYVDGRSYYERLQKYIFYWFWYMDFDKNGLPVWNSADHSGMDNQDSRAGYFNAFRYEGVDLACYLYRELKSMEIIADKLGFKEDAIEYKEHAARLMDQINKNFWDEEDGFYYDRDEYTGKLVRVKSIAGFLPLYIGAPSKKRADRLINEHLLNEEEFNTDYPIPSWSKSEPDYSQEVRDHGCNWRGTTWIPTNYMVFHGLVDYGYMDLAKELAKTTFRMVLEINYTTREYYNAENGKGFGLDPFFGWSSLGYLMPYEFELNYDPSDLNDKTLTPIANEYLGIDFCK